MCPVLDSPSRETTMTSPAEFTGSGFHTTLPSDCLTSSGLFPSFAWLCEKNPSRKLVNWHTKNVAKPVQPVECDQFIYRADECTYVSVVDSFLLFLCCSNPTSASRLPLSRLGQPDTIPVLVLPSGGMTAKHRKDFTAEQCDSLVFVISVLRLHHLPCF
ncbi:hypothetical protein CSKR_103319 [Clonorchis sinensis]|uniref:Uncharacterized protein n=1 Tax=Clonorchis sinensis TaxID=79923 RepID=A0A3R7CAC1_CLOSI|nr:hypothetical protein CSKR_103319 [Clonorchis sinensis]